MGRHNKQRSSDLETIKRLLYRHKNQELIGQTKLKHYHETEFVKCALCEATNVKLHRHRIVPSGEYVDSNVIIVCVVCHKFIHKTYNELKPNSPDKFMFALKIAELGIKSNGSKEART